MNEWNVLVAEPIGEPGLERLAKKARVDIRLNLSASDLRAIIPPYQALIVRSATRVDESLLQAGRNLLVVGRAGVGVDNVDVDAATRRGITVVNAPTTNTIAAAEHTVALMFALARHVPLADKSVRARQWQRERFIGVELVGKQLGLVGLGRVGGEVARRGVGLGMRVVAFDPYVAPERARQLQIQLASFDDLLASSDFISLHAPLTRETKTLLGPDEFARMKPGARLVNAARGALVDEASLLQALDSGRLAGAALDVFTQEPPDNALLLDHPRVVLTPHIGGSTEESRERVAVEIADQVLAVLQGQPARFAVNAPLVSKGLEPHLPPFIELAERLGRFYLQWVGGPLEAIEIEYAGRLAAEETAVLTAAVIKGLLEPIHEDRVNMINAMRVAQMHGLKISERKTQAAARFEDLVVLRGKRRVAGTVLQEQPHIVQLDGYWVDFVPAGHLLLLRHRDRPGMIGKIGTLLGSADINIAAMQVARDAPRGEAIMVLSLDDAIPPATFETLRQVPDIEWAKALQI